jgi:hypothetical protein
MRMTSLWHLFLTFAASLFTQMIDYLPQESCSINFLFEMRDEVLFTFSARRQACCISIDNILLIDFAAQFKNPKYTGVFFLLALK